MNKLLIYYRERKLKPTGGPAGYLYNLRNGLDKIQKKENVNVQINFLRDDSTKLEENVRLKNMVPKRLLELRRVFKYMQLLKKKAPIDETLYQYDMIHFHGTEYMYLNREFLNSYKGKVILTSHSPCVYSKEKISRLNPKDYKIFQKQLDRLVEMDRYAFERADYIIFPCEEAEEPYYHTWEQYAELRNANKYRYLPTGITQCHARVSREDYRKKYNIPEDAFVVSYAGRHNEIKGYGDLKEIGSQLLQGKEVYFLIAGREEPMTGLSDSHWVEVGWTTDPHSLIAASDVFVLPNRETYFDLILLEVISLGVPVVLSNTGGNQYFKRFTDAGMIFYDNLTEAKEAIQTFKNMSKEERLKMGQKNRQIFEDNFTVEHFTENYVKVIQNIAEDN